MHSKGTQTHTQSASVSCFPCVNSFLQQNQLPIVSLKVSSATRTTLPHQALSAATLSHLAFKVLPVDLGIQQQRLAGHTPQRNTLVCTHEDTKTHISGRSEAAAAAVAAKAAREGRSRGPQPAAECVSRGMQLMAAATLAAFPLEKPSLRASAWHLGGRPSLVPHPQTA